MMYNNANINWKITSNFSFFILGFFTTILINQWIISYYYLLFLLCFFLSIIFLLFSKRSALKAILFLIGFSLSLFILKLNLLNLKNSTNYIKENELSELKDNEEFSFQLESVLFKNYWNAKILNTSFMNKFVIVQKFGKSKNSFRCKNNLFTIKYPSQKEFSILHNTNFFIDAKKCELIKKPPNLSERIKNKIEKTLENNGIIGYSLEISLGFLLGDASKLKFEFKKKILTGGILHLFAASGLHLSIFNYFILFICNRIKLNNYYLLHTTPLVISFFYLALLDFPLSFVRAYVFGIILLFQKYVFRKVSAMDLIFYSAFFIYLFDPKSFLSLSFNLSYSAIIGIFFLKKLIDSLLWNHQMNFIKESVSVTIGAGLGTFPVLVYYFQSFSFGSFLLNLFLVPFGSFIFPLLLVSLSIEFLPIQFIKDSLWGYSNLSLRLFAFLSDYCSTNLGFFETMKNNQKTIFFIYGLFIFLLNLIFLLKIKMSHYKSLKFLNHYFTISFIFLFFSFLFFTYYQKDETYADKELIFTDSKFVFYLNNDHLILKGSCKYSFKNLFPIFSKLQEEQIHTIKTIYVEDEYCLSYIFRYKNDFKKTTLIYSDPKISSWVNYYPMFEFKYSNHLSQFFINQSTNLVFFDPKRENEFKIEKILDQIDSGKIIIFSPFPKFQLNKIENRIQNLIQEKPNWKLLNRI